MVSSATWGAGRLVVLGHQSHLANAQMDSPLGLFIQNRHECLAVVFSAEAACLRLLGSAAACQRQACDRGAAGSLAAVVVVSAAGKQPSTACGLFM